MKNTMSYITKLVTDHDITFLCEHWLQHSEIILVSDIFCDNICYFQSSMNPEERLNGRPFGGIGFICKKIAGLTYKLIDCDSERLYGLQIAANGEVLLTIYGVYMPYDNHSSTQLELYIDTIDKLQAMMKSNNGNDSIPVIIVGDMNTRLPQALELTSTWYRSKPFNSRSYLLYDFLVKNDMLVTNFQFKQDVNFTYHKGVIYSYIDHIFMPSYMLPLVKDCAILNNNFDNVSDHNAISCALNIYVSQVPDVVVDNENNMKPSFPKPMWQSDKFVNYYMKEIYDLADLLPIIDNESVTCDNALSVTNKLCDDLINVIHEATMRSVKKYQPPKGCSRKRCWTPSCRQARDRNRFYYSLWKEARSQKQGHIYKC